VASHPSIVSGIAELRRLGTDEADDGAAPIFLLSAAGARDPRCCSD
jgi:hypothetical protein